MIMAGTQVICFLSFENKPIVRDLSYIHVVFIIVKCV